MKNSSYEERKQIIRPSDQDLGKMYQKAPIRQILSLKLSTLQQLILLNFFSHDYDVWKLSINGISKSFGNAKNRKNVAAAVKKLESLGYLLTTNYTYEVDINKINEDYQSSIQKKERDTNDDRGGIEQKVTGDTNNNRVSDMIISPPDMYDTKVPDMNNNRVPDTKDNRVPDTIDNNNNRNIRELDNSKGINETDKGKQIIETEYPNLGTGIISANNPVPNTSAPDISDWTNVFDNYPAKQAKPVETILPKYNPYDDSYNFFRFSNRRDLWNLYYSNPKYQYMKLLQFEKVMVVSLICRLESDGKQLPVDNKALQVVAIGMINLDQFDETFKYCSTKEETIQNKIGNILNQYQLIK